MTWIFCVAPPIYNILATGETIRQRLEFIQKGFIVYAESSWGMCGLGSRLRCWVDEGHALGTACVFDGQSWDS